MNRKSLLRWMSSYSDNPKSKTCLEHCRRIKNPKWIAVVSLVFVFVWCRAVAHAQPAKILRIGFLGPTSASSNTDRLEALRAGLRDLGYVEGKNLVIEFRWAEGKFDLLPELAAELVRLNVDVILTAGSPAIRAAKNATTTIPIVMVTSGDPVAFGFVASLARPGGNITGSSIFSPELSAKRLELLKEILPRAQRIAVLLNPENSINQRNLEEMERTAKFLKVGLHRYEVRAAAEFTKAFAAMTKQRIDAVALPDDDFVGANGSRIAEFAAKQRLPSVGRAEFVEAGGLIGYGVNIPQLYRHAAVFVDKIVKGSKPADLPVEQPMKFEFVINLKTAKQIGLEIPQWTLMKADKVIR